MNPYLPVAPFATDPGMLGMGIQAPINATPQEGNVLLASVRPHSRIGLDEGTVPSVCCTLLNIWPVALSLIRCNIRLMHVAGG